MTESRTGFCRHCGRRCHLRRAAVNRRFHLTLTLVSGGLWLPVWCLNTVVRARWRCTACGWRDVRADPARASLRAWAGRHHELAVCGSMAAITLFVALWSTHGAATAISVALVTWGILAAAA